MSAEKKAVPEDRYEPLAARLSDVETRVTLLESKVREVVARLPPGQAAPKAPRPRPRCPGCSLELPPGKKGDSCVWCGFVFEAVKGARASK